MERILAAVPSVIVAQYVERVLNAPPSPAGAQLECTELEEAMEAMPAGYQELMEACWAQEAAQRPAFDEVFGSN